VAQQESQLSSNFLITSVNNVSSNRNIPIVCSFCGKNGHTENACFRKKIVFLMKKAKLINLERNYAPTVTEHVTLLVPATKSMVTPWVQNLQW